MSDLRGRAKENMHRVAEAAKTAADAIVDSGKNFADEAAATVAGKGKDTAHKAGKKIAGVGKRIQNV